MLGQCDHTVPVSSDRAPGNEASEYWREMIDFFGSAALAFASLSSRRAALGGARGRFLECCVIRVRLCLPALGRWLARAPRRRVVQCLLTPSIDDEHRTTPGNRSSLEFEQFPLASVAARWRGSLRVGLMAA